jgi:lipid A disaccharide synthetase
MRVAEIALALACSGGSVLEMCLLSAPCLCLRVTFRETLNVFLLNYLLNFGRTALTDTLCGDKRAFLLASLS